MFIYKSSSIESWLLSLMWWSKKWIMPWFGDVLYKIKKLNIPEKTSCWMSFSGQMCVCVYIYIIFFFFYKSGYKHFFPPWLYIFCFNYHVLLRLSFRLQIKVSLTFIKCLFDFSHLSHLLTQRAYRMFFLLYYKYATFCRLYLILKHVIVSGSS